MNREFSSRIISKLLAWGVAEFYVCAGARNFPLVETLLNIKSDKKIIFNHFEERSAAFYALGRIKSLKKPVAVLTTSGTAVGELLPAVMESYYSGLPLVCITADRPRSHRGTGAPQAAEQNGIFGSYVSACFDLEIGEDFELPLYNYSQPIHINVCFDEPLRSGVLNPPRLFCNVKRDLFCQYDYKFDLKKLNLFINKSKSLIIILSHLKLKKNGTLITFLKALDCPVYFESTSNLRECTQLNHLKIYSADNIWKNRKTSSFNFDSVLKIGGTPTHRLWRDLDEKYKDIKVFSLNEHIFSGLPRAEHITTNLSVFFDLSIKEKLKKITNKNVNKFYINDKKTFENQKELIKKFPNSEQAFFYYLSAKIKNKSRVFISNSMPIRYWDLCATYKQKNLYIEASRGLNGIDGQISTFLGFACEFSAQNWGIFGDLTTLYDFAGLWMIKQRPKLRINLVVINNSGGKIFRKMLPGWEGEFCQNNHNLNFKNFAQMWDLKYVKIVSPNQLKRLKCHNNLLIEIIPDLEQTDNFGLE